MSSNWALWDFLKRHPHLVSPNIKGVYGLYTSDAFVEKILLSRLPSSSSLSTPPWKTLLGSELTASFLEDHFQNLGFFDDASPLRILQGEKISSQVVSFIEKSLDGLPHYLVLAFSKKSPIFDNLASRCPKTFFKIEEPKFWQGGLLLECLCRELRVPLSPPLKSYLVEALPMKSIVYGMVLNQISLLFPNTWPNTWPNTRPNTQKVTVSQIRKLISPSKWDHFSLAQQFGQRKFADFFKKVIESKGDFESFRPFFSFMQGHLSRLLDPSYIDEKPHLSKYDKEVLAQSKLWKSQELVFHMRLFGELEIEAKKQSPFTMQRMRSLYLRALEYENADKDADEDASER